MATMTIKSFTDLADLRSTVLEMIAEKDLNQKKAARIAKKRATKEQIRIHKLQTAAAAQVIAFEKEEAKANAKRAAEVELAAWEKACAITKLAKVNAKVAIIVAEGIEKVEVKQKVAYIYTANSKKKYHVVSIATLANIKEKATKVVGKGLMKDMDQVFSSIDGKATIGIDVVDTGKFKLVQSEGCISASFYKTKLKEFEMETTKQMISLKTEMSQIINEIDGHTIYEGSIAIDDNSAYQAYCYNFACSSRDYNIGINELYRKLTDLNDRLTIGKGYILDLTKFMINKYGTGIIHKNPTKRCGSDIKLKDVEKIYVPAKWRTTYTTDEYGVTTKNRYKIDAINETIYSTVSYNGKDKHHTINILDTQLIFASYPDGNDNWNTKQYFVNKFGANGIRMFAEFKSDRTKWQRYLNRAFEIIEFIQETNNAIKEYKENNKNKPAVINAVFEYDSITGSTYSICPHCGERVKIFSSITNHLGIDKNTVEHEMYTQTYDFGNGRIVKINSNGDIVSDTDNVTITEIPEDYIISDNEIITTAATISNSIFDNPCDISENTSIDEMDYELERNIRNAEHHKVLADRYNTIIAEHKNESRWIEIRKGLGIIESGIILSTMHNGLMTIGGKCSSLFNYDTDICGDYVNWNKSDKLIDWANQIGKAFDISDDRNEFLEYYGSSLIHFYNENWIRR